MILDYIAARVGGLTDGIYNIRPVQKIKASAGSFPINPWLGTKPAGGKSRFGLSTYEKSTVIDHWARRQNTRAATDESIQARTILIRDKDSVIGAGLQPDPTPSFKILGITREDGEAWAENVKERFNMWALSKNSDLTGRNNFYQNTRLMRWQQSRDGEYFIRLTYSKDKTLTNPLQISFIDANQIRGDEFTFSSGPVSQQDGIEKDENGKEKAYKIWTPDLKRPGRYKFETVPAFDKKTGRPIVIHGFDPEWAGQARGIPEISHALQDFEKITTFDAATIEKAISGASMGFTVQNDLQDPSDMGLDDLDEGGINVSDDDPTIARTYTTGVNEVTHRIVPETTQREPGTYNVLGGRQGDKLTAIPSNSPPETTNDYINGKSEWLAASVSQPPEITMMKFTNSHSASRGALGLYADVKKIKQNDVASDALNVIYSAWLSEEIATGQIRAPGFSDPLLKSAWLMINWTGDPLPDVDPLKTIQAKKGAVEMGWTDLDTEAKNYNGSDGKSNRAKLARQLPELSTDPFGIRQMEADEENLNNPDEE